MWFMNTNKTMKALIFKNKVVDKQQNEFPVSPEMFWVDCEDSIPIGWGYSNGNFHDPDTRTEDEKKSEGLFSLRRKRNRKLEISDWSQLPDTSLSEAKKTEWATYRQSLRDITNGLTTLADIKAVTWPTKPE